MIIDHRVLERLINTDNIVSELWHILNSIWSFEGDIENYYKEHEQEVCDFERKINCIFYEIYFYLHREINKAKLQVEPPIIILDGMSIRESNILVKDLVAHGYGIIEYTYTLSALPSDTSSFRRKLNMEYTEIRYNEIPSKIDLSIPIWLPYPDEILHHAGRIIPPPEAYNKTKDFLLKVLDRIEESCIITITSDHGYILVEHTWPVPDRDRSFLKKIFGSRRFIETTNIPPKKLETLKAIPEYKSYVFIDKEYSYIKGRYFWPIGGYSSIITHGGLSFMECILPLIKVRV